MFKKHSTHEKQSSRRFLNIETTSLITDVKYNHNGSKVAVSDSEGNVFVYQRQGDGFVKTGEFKGDQAAIWRISWADPQFGELIAIGSFKKKVGVFQNKNNKWTEIARHQNHEGSVNHVEWAPAAYALKLYSAASDGSICIFQARKNMWDLFSFHTHQSSIHSLAIKPVALNEQNRGLQSVYPTIATISKDLQLRVWRHPTEAKLLNLQNLKDYQQNVYKQVLSVKPHNELTRTILFQPIWAENSGHPQYSIISGSEDGKVKVTSFQKDSVVDEYFIHEGETPVVNLSQSLTGKFVTVGIASHSEEKTFLYQQKQKGKWQLVQQQ